MVAKRVCTTDSSSASDSRIVWSLSSATGVPAVATMLVWLIPSSLSRWITAMISDVVPERQITTARS